MLNKKEEEKYDELTLEERIAFYNKISLNMSNSYSNIIQMNLKNKVGKFDDELVYLIESIPNIETYLTDKQIKLVNLFKSDKNTTSVSIRLNNANVYSELFGKISGKGGIFKKLLNVYYTLNKLNKITVETDEDKYFHNKLLNIYKKNKQEENIKIIQKMIYGLPDYKKLFSENDKTLLRAYIEFKDFKKIDNYYGVNSKETILTSDNSILKRLKKYYDEEIKNNG
jgi:hypothetical protein